MMDAIKLIWFESKKQITSFPFIITLVLLTVFSFTQMSEVFHIPVNSESDIQALDRAGERDFIDVSNTDEELKEKTSQYLEQMISAGTISDENAKEFEPRQTLAAVFLSYHFLSFICISAKLIARSTQLIQIECSPQRTTITPPSPAPIAKIITTPKYVSAL